MFSFLNISYRRVGGVRFWTLGRMGGSFYVSSPETFTRKQADKLDNACLAALVRELRPAFYIPGDATLRAI